MSRSMRLGILLFLLGGCSSGGSEPSTPDAAEAGPDLTDLVPTGSGCRSDTERVCCKGDVTAQPVCIEEKGYCRKDYRFIARSECGLRPRDGG